MWRNKQWLYCLSLFFIVVISFLVRFAALNKYEVPPSPDYGNYLTQVDIIKGHDLLGYGLRYNPLFFFVLNVFLGFLDEFTALKVAAAFVFSIIAVPFFLLAKKLSGNQLAALIATWLFVFFEGYSEMIAWGGNSDFLGFFFLLFALLFLISALNEPSRKNLLLTGFFLSLVIGTHFLVAFFTVFSLLLFAVLAYMFNQKARNRIVKVLSASSFAGLVFSLPYFFVYQTFLSQSSTDLLRFDLLAQIGEMLSGLTWLFRSARLVTVIVVALGIFALSRNFKENRNVGSVLICLFLAPFMLALISEQPERWFYFLPIPIMLCFALYLGHLFTTIKGLCKKILLLVFCLVLVIGAETTVSSINRLEGAIDYYQTTGNDEIQAFTWIKENTVPNAVFATSGPNKVVGGAREGSCYGWWIEGFSNRKCISTGLTKFYTYGDERQEVVTANRIFAGAYVFEDGNTRVSETFPASVSNPEIATLIDGDYTNVLYLNDGEQDIVSSPIGDGQVIWHDTPFYAKNKTMNIFCDETSVNCTFTYEWDNLRFIRSVMLGKESSSVDLVFKIYPNNVVLKRFNVQVWASYFTSIQDYQVENATIMLHQRLPSNQLVETKITVLDTNGRLDNAQLLLEDPKYSMPVAIYSLRPAQDNSLYVKMRLSIITQTTNDDHTIHLCNSYDLVKDAKIDYILLNKAGEEYQWFSSDLKHFAKVFENGKIAIFKVLLGENG